MSDNSNLHNAKTKRNDEYFTFYDDVAKECEHYKHHFKGKVIYCNCDDLSVLNSLSILRTILNS